jgi:hypothetical protein
MARAEASSVVPVEVFVEQQVIAPMRVLLKSCRFPVNGSPAALITKKDACQSPRELFSLDPFGPSPGSWEGPLLKWQIYFAYG